MSVASVNSALQRARATLQSRGVSSDDAAPPMDAPRKGLLARYVRAFETYDITALTALIKEDARQSMPPYDLWLSGREDILAWWFGPGIGCRGSRLVSTVGANGPGAVRDDNASPSGTGPRPRALPVLPLRPH